MRLLFISAVEDVMKSSVPSSEDLSIVVGSLPHLSCVRLPPECQATYPAVNYSTIIFAGENIHHLSINHQTKLKAATYR